MAGKREGICWRKETNMLSLFPLPAQLVSFLEDSFSLGYPVKHSWMQLDLYLYAPGIQFGKGVNLRFVIAGGVRARFPIH